MPGYYWIRAVEAPNFHSYLQGAPTSTPSPGPGDAYLLAASKAGQFNVVDGLTFMNNGTYGPTPRVVVDAFKRYNDLLAEDPTNNYWNEGRDAVRVVQMRK